jgi:hypothetical protein
VTRTPPEQPTGLDQLDPAPDPAPDPGLPPRPQARRKGAVEKAVFANLVTLKVDWRKDGVAAAILTLAREMDEGALTPRDSAGHAAQVRQGLAQLREWNPGGVTGDVTDAAVAQVEKTRNLYVVEGPSSS